MANQQQFEKVMVGPFEVAALPQDQLVSTIVNWPVTDEPAVMCHLHVGALNHRDDPTFVTAMNAAEVVYADGMATVVVGKAAGAANIERAGLTDIGHDIVAQLATKLGRDVRLALLGGPEGLAKRAGDKLAESHSCELVYEAHGYRNDSEWIPVLAEVRSAKPDAVFVGLGMPREATWAQQFKDQLPPALILASGGFFGHVVGDEKRAPEWAQGVGLEWMWRVGQDPKRLAGRYAQGLLSTAVLSVEAIRKRKQ